MTSGNDKRKGGMVDGLILLEIGGSNVRFDVVDGEKGNTSREGHGLAETQANEERAHEARALSDRHSTDLVEGYTRFPQSPIDDRAHVYQVLPRRDLRNHTPIGAMNGYLRGDEVGQDAAAVLDNRRRGLITGAFDSENEHVMETVYSFSASRRMLST
jgi:hypothetical protein